MKYSKKQIEKAYLKWETEARLNPGEFMDSEECFNYGASEMAKKHTKTLINYMNE